MACLLGQGTADLLPLVVLAMLGRAVTGYFYIAFIIAIGLATFAQSFSTSLLVEAAHDEAALDRLAHRTVMRCLTVVLPVIVLAVLVAPVLLRFFGPDYSAQGGLTLRLLMLAALPQTAVTVAMSVERIRGRADRVLRYQAVTAGAVVVLIVPLIHLAGLAGVGWTWLAAQGIAGLLTIPTLRKVFAGHRAQHPIESTT